MFALRTLVSIAALALGASALVLDPMHNLGRGLEVTAHRRHAANVLNLRSPVPRQTITERRALRQKRCVQRQQASSTSAAPTSSSAQDNVPINVAPAPTSTQAETTTPAADNGNNNSGTSSPPATGSGDTYTGELTFYDVGLGACGGTNTDSDMIAAASMLLYDGFNGYTGGNPNSNPICGKQAVITYGGKSITVTIVDRCVGCAKYDLDLSPTAFNQLADPSLGRLQGATWQFV